ncbi:MAG: tetratricopeptide repeat protein [Bacteroidota bacterium]
MLNRSIAYKRLEQYERAKDDIEKAQSIAVVLGDVNLLFRSANEMGLIHMHLKQYEEAIRLFQEANHLDFGTKTFVNLGLVHGHLAQKDEAVFYYKKAIDFTKQVDYRFRAYHYIGKLYFESGQFDLALENLNRAKEIFPDLTSPEVEDIDLHQSIGNCQRDLGLKDEAIKTLNYSYSLMKQFNETRDALATKFTQIAFIKTVDVHEANLDLIDEKQTNKWKILSIVLIAIIAIGVLLVSLKNLRKKYRSSVLKTDQLKSKINVIFNKIPQASKNEDYS